MSQKTDDFTGNLGIESVEGMSEQVYQIRELPADKEVLQDIDIDHIIADPMQPRRIIPALVRGQCQTEGTFLFDAWRELACDERGRIDLDLRRLVKEEEFPQLELRYDRSKQPGPIEATLLLVVDLAASIRRDGLINPITVVSQGKHYLLETGERRWLAYGLLRQFDPDGNWRTIPTRVVKSHNVWRQASENNARQDLSAIAKARQFSLLLMDLIGRSNFHPIEAFEREQDFYAQIADAKLYRVPHGKNEQLCNAMGVTDRAMITNYRKLLVLPSALWVRGDDENIPLTQLLNAFNNLGNMTAKKPPAPLKVSPLDRLFTGEKKPNLSQVDKLWARVGEGDNKAREALRKQKNALKLLVDALEETLGE